MKNRLSSSLFAVAVAGLAVISAASCSIHDPIYENVTRPNIPIAPVVITGNVSDMLGDKISGAVISVGGVTLTTDAEGRYFYNVPAAGLYAIEASATGYLPKSASVNVITIDYTQIFIQNFMLARSDNKVVVENIESDKVKTETIRGNALNGTITSTLDVPTSILPDNVGIILQPVYSEKDSEEITTKASSVQKGVRKLLVGTNIRRTDGGNTLNGNVTLSFDVKNYVQGKTSLEMYDKTANTWKVVPSSMVETFEDHVTITTDILTTYGFFANIDISNDSAAKDIKFIPNEWNNLYGSSTIHPESSSYIYFSGAELSHDQGDTQMKALLLETMAHDLGDIYKAERTGIYPLGIDIPVGIRVELKGTQEYKRYSYSNPVSSKAEIDAVVADYFDKCDISAKSHNRVHTGGGSY